MSKAPLPTYLRTHRKRSGQVLQRYNPDVIVVEDGRGTKRRSRACRLIQGIEALAKRQSIPLVRVSRSAIRRTLAPAKTKQEIAEAVARCFPELASRLPRPGKPWMTEDERMNIFDAVSLVLGAPGNSSTAPHEKRKFDVRAAKD